MKTFKMIVAYPPPKDASAFDKVYQQEHVPMAIANLHGKTKIVATKVLRSPQGDPPVYCIAEVYFPSMEALPAVRRIDRRQGKLWPTQRKFLRVDLLSL